jgi:hypothetical protein
VTKWLEFIYPPLCQICKEPSKIPLFCEGCWEMCSLPLPLGRCHHCFEEIEGDLCERCRRKASLRYPSAFVFEPTPPALHLISLALRESPASLAAFAFFQWDRLNWPQPDVVVPLPKAEDIAREFASLSGSFFADVLKSGEEWTCESSILEEDSTVLLIAIAYSYEEMTQAIEAILEAFPKKVFVLTLVP